MRLNELFSSGNEMKDKLRQAALDIITPFMGQDLPFVTVQQVIEGLRNRRLGITIDRSLLMNLLNPDEVNGIAKIEGDRIYLQNAEGAAHTQTEEPGADTDEKPDHVTNMAQQGAKKSMEK